MKTYLMNKWIPVTQELPYNNEIVLVSTRSGLVQLGFCYDQNWYSLDNTIGMAFNIDVTAWIRLPDAYREEK